MTLALVIIGAWLLLAVIVAVVWSRFARIMLRDPSAVRLRSQRFTVLPSPRKSNQEGRSE